MKVYTFGGTSIFKCCPNWPNWIWLDLDVGYAKLQYTWIDGMYKCLYDFTTILFIINYMYTYVYTSQLVKCSTCSVGVYNFSLWDTKYVTIWVYSILWYCLTQIYQECLVESDTLTGSIMDIILHWYALCIMNVTIIQYIIVVWLFQVVLWVEES